MLSDFKVIKEEDDCSRNVAKWLFDSTKGDDGGSLLAMMTIVTYMKIESDLVNTKNILDDNERRINATDEYTDEMGGDT